MPGVARADRHGARRVAGSPRCDAASTRHILTDTLPTAHAVGYMMPPPAGTLVVGAEVE